MISVKNRATQSKDITRSLAVLPVMSFVIIAALVSRADVGGVREAPPVLLALNTLFLFIAPFLAAYLAARSYIETDSTVILFMGCGLLVFSCASLFAGLAMRGPDGPNNAVTIFNSGALLASLFQGISATLSLTGSLRFKSPFGGRRASLTAAYLGALSLMALITVASLDDLMPVFFVQNQGPTLLRQLVLGLAVTFFALSSFLFMLIHFRTGTVFLYWYALSLLLITEGLATMLFLSSLGSPLNWMGRFFQYIGGVYFLIALSLAFKEARSRGLSIERALSNLVDIAELKKAEEALRESEGRYRHLVSVLPTAIYTCDAEGVITFYNDLAAESWGRRPQLGDTAQKFCGAFRVFRPDGSPLSHNRTPMAVAVREGSRFRGEQVVFGRPDGSRIVALVNIDPIRDARGRIIGAISAFTDVTDRVRAEEELREAYKKLHRTLESITDGFLSMDREWRSTYFNETGARMIGMRREDLIGKVVWELFPHAVNSKFYAEYHRAVATEKPVHFEEFYPEPLNLWLECHCYPSTEGLSVYFRDVTERKRIEEELRRSRDELELRVQERTAELLEAGETLKEQAALLELAHDAILVRDREGRIAYWNSGAEETYGWSRDEAMGKVAHTLLSTRFPKPLEEMIEDLLATGQWEGELRHITRSGKSIVSASRWAVRQEDGRKPGEILEINRDITERKNAEEQLRAYTAKLEQSNQALQDFASIASHDLQEPLRKVRTFGKMLEDTCAASLSDEGKSYLGRMLSTTGRMQALLTSLREYSKVTSEAKPFEEVRLKDLIGEVLADLEVRVHQTGGRVEVGELPILQADPAQMRQLFQNLIGNALKFHKEEEKPAVKIHAHRREDHHEILVEDNGIGFDEKYLDKIFSPFQRLHGKSSSFEGTGMGLAICKKIVERHGGSITARSAPGTGSTFIIELPREF